MKMRKFFHIVAVLFSSLGAMISHAKAQDATTSTTKEKKADGELTPHHRRHASLNGSSSDLASLDDPPHHHRLKSSASSDSSDIKNSRHAATFTRYDDQEAPPPLKLDPALMAGAERPMPPLPNLNAGAPAAPAPLPGDEFSRFPWKRQIVTTTFWIGEDPTQNNPVPNRSSCWDPHWAQNYGGSDTPDTTQRTAEYIPAGFIPNQNPFYVALPYNDMEHGGHKAEAPQVIPWFAKAYKGPSQSVCKGRWIAIRFGKRVCYAQWEDAGPFRTDHYQYVFGNDRPRPNLNGGAGLDVSPAVRDFLGMNSSDVTDWKFVDFDEVPTGPWARFGDNNTFVQNVRKSGVGMAEVVLNPVSEGFRQMPAPTVEIR